jgi:hypothetical protein
MLTRRDVLDHLKRVGIRRLSEIKGNCREFEQYMAVYYDYEIEKKRPRPPSPRKQPTSLGKK